MPQVRCLNLGLGVDVSFRGVRDAGGIEALLWQGSLAFHHVQLLSAAAAVEDRARTGHFRERARESARRDGVPSAGLCGDAGACASLDERAAAGNALDGAAEAEATCGAETAKAPKAGERGADAIAFCGDRRTAGSVLASAVLRFQCVQPRKEEGKVELHTRESSDSRTGETSERLAVEQLGFLPWRSGGARGDRRGRVRREETPRPRFKLRTWGTLRVVLSCEYAKASSFDRRESERIAIRHPGHPPGKIELHARESGDSRTGKTSERLAVEQLGVLPGRSGGARGDRRGRVKEKQPQDPGSHNEPGAPSVLF